MGAHDTLPGVPPRATKPEFQLPRRLGPVSTYDSTLFGLADKPFNSSALNFVKDMLEAFLKLFLVGEKTLRVKFSEVVLGIMFHHMKSAVFSNARLVGVDYFSGLTEIYGATRRGQCFVSFFDKFELRS